MLRSGEPCPRGTTTATTPGAPAHRVTMATQTVRDAHVSPVQERVAFEMR